MEERSIFTTREASFLKTLVDNDVDFMIVGLSAAILQGAPAVTQDIDLWVRDVEDSRFRRALKDVGATFVPQTGLNPPMLAGESVRLFDLVIQMSGLGSFEDELKHSLLLDVGGITVRVLSIERILVSKRAANREKDRLVLPVLRDAVATMRTLKGRPRPGSRSKKKT